MMGGGRIEAWAGEWNHDGAGAENYRAGAGCQIDNLWLAARGRDEGSKCRKGGDRDAPRHKRLQIRLRAIGEDEILTVSKWSGGKSKGDTANGGEHIRLHLIGCYQRPRLEGIEIRPIFGGDVWMVVVINLHWAEERVGYVKV